MLRQLLRAALDKLPARCEICHAWPSRVLCPACLGRFQRLEHRCRTCALPLTARQQQCGACLQQPPPLQSCIAAFSYEYPWSLCITRFKYGDDPGWARSLSSLLAQLPEVRAAVQEADLLLPMPLSTERLKQRGFNQAHELARRLAPGKTRADILLRIRDTPPQSRLSRAERLRNVKGAFMVAPLALRQVRQRKMLLLDDVMTSGASLFAAASALRQSGAASVAAVVLARTELPA